MSLTHSPSTYGKISFCDKQAFNVQEVSFKSTIIQYLKDMYDVRVISKHHDTIDTSSFMKCLKKRKDKCMMCLRSKGNPYYLFLTKIDHVHPVCIFIDKKVKPGHTYPRMVLYPLNFCESTFNDTLIEGEMVKPVLENDNWTFLIHDLLVYKGSIYYKFFDLPSRINMASKFINLDHVVNLKNDPCTFKIKRYFNNDELEQVLKSADGCRGVYIRDMKLPGSRDLLLRFDYVFGEKEGNPRLRHEFWVFKTDKPDVYGIIGPSMIKNSSKENFITEYTDTACVPSMKVSIYLRKLFESKEPHKEGILLTCEFNPCFEKWIPLIEDEELNQILTSNNNNKEFTRRSSSLNIIRATSLSNDSIPRKSSSDNIHGNLSVVVPSSKFNGRKSFENCLAGNRANHCDRPLSNGACSVGHLPGLLNPNINATIATC